MQYVIGSIIALGTLVLAVGMITGRVKARSCCAPADPDRDLRMRPDGYEVPSKQVDVPGDHRRLGDY